MVRALQLLAGRHYRLSYETTRCEQGNSGNGFFVPVINTRFKTEFNISLFFSIMFAKFASSEQITELKRKLLNLRNLRIMKINNGDSNRPTEICKKE